MRIEVIANSDLPNQVKGDLLEDLTKHVLEAQSYEVTTKVRVTACELDLLCIHHITRKTIYVECKAHREALSSNVLTNLLGTISFKGYSEGWLFSTGPLGKDAKGFMVEWENKPPQERERLSIYTSDRIVEASIRAKAICQHPTEPLVLGLFSSDRLGEWILLVSQWGYFWACPYLENGIPVGVIVLNAVNNIQVNDITLLKRIADSDTSLNNLDFEYFNTQTLSQQRSSDESVSVVEVEFGESWSDYRPARPEHFVGRTREQKLLLHFLHSVKNRKTNSRVFAIKGSPATTSFLRNYASERRFCG
jgi:hypothetical protein